MDKDRIVKLNPHPNAQKTGQNPNATAIKILLLGDLEPADNKLRDKLDREGFTVAKVFNSAEIPLILRLFCPEIILIEGDSSFENLCQDFLNFWTLNLYPNIFLTVNKSNGEVRIKKFENPDDLNKGEEFSITQFKTLLQLHARNTIR